LKFNIPISIGFHALNVKDGLGSGKRVKINYCKRTWMLGGPRSMVIPIIKVQIIVQQKNVADILCCNLLMTTIIGGITGAQFKVSFRKILTGID